MSKLNKFFIALAFVGLSAGATAQVVDSGSCGDDGDNLTWQLTGTGDNLTLTISGTGAMANYEWYNRAPWYSQRENIKTLVLENGMTTIGNSAFLDCSSLSGTLTIPNSVITIGDWAFSDCSGLESVTIGNSVTEIRDYAFFYCSGLTGALTIPNSVIIIGDSTFTESSFTSIYNYSTVPPYCGNTFSNSTYTNATLYVPCGTANAYQTANGWNAFSNIQDTLPIMNTIIDTICSNDYQYYYKGLPITESGIYTDTLYSSYGCDSIITLNLTVIDCIEWTFENDTLTINGTGAMPDYAITNPQHIGNRSLKASSEIAEISAPWNMHSDEILYIVIGEGITKIGGYAFYNCVNAVSVELASTIEAIGEYAFAQCGSLEEIIIHNENGIDVDETAFDNVNTSQITLVVPEGSEDNYNDDGVWGNFIIEAESSVPQTAISLSNIYSTNNRSIVIENFVGNISVYNVQGQVVAGKHSASGIIEISVPQSGIYLVKLENSFGKVVVK